jgi:hypothetical protein
VWLLVVELTLERQPQASNLVTYYLSLALQGDSEKASRVAADRSIGDAAAEPSGHSTDQIATRDFAPLAAIMNS